MTIHGKRYKVKSGGRFTLFVVFTMIFIVMVLNMILGLNSASSLTQQEYIEITIQDGDTLWNIAREYMPDNKDVRRAVHTLCNINQISAHELKAGQILIVPIN